MAFKIKISKLKTKTQNLEFLERLYSIVKKIPKGKVTTYGMLAFFINQEPEKTGSAISGGLKKCINARYVGYLLHNNPDPEKIPCHRVVNKNGKVAENYKFGGWRAQVEKLRKEGVVFKDRVRVDLGKSLWVREEDNIL